MTMQLTGRMIVVAPKVPSSAIGSGIDKAIRCGTVQNGVELGVAIPYKGCDLKTRKR